MIKQHIVKALIGVALALTLLAGAALPGSAAAVVHTAPAHHLLACGGIPSTPPCL